MTPVDLAAERAAAAERREAQSLDRRARAVVHHMATDPKAPPGPWAQEQWPTLTPAEVRAVLARAEQLSADSLSTQKRLTAEEVRTVEETTRRIRDFARKAWTDDPRRSYRDVFAALTEAGLEVPWSSFSTYHGPAVRRALGLIGVSGKRADQLNAGGSGIDVTTKNRAARAKAKKAAAAPAVPASPPPEPKEAPVAKTTAPPEPPPVIPDQPAVDVDLGRTTFQDGLTVVQFEGTVELKDAIGPGRRVVTITLGETVDAVVWRRVLDYLDRFVFRRPPAPEAS